MRTKTTTEHFSGDERLDMEHEHLSNNKRGTMTFKNTLANINKTKVETIFEIETQLSLLLNPSLRL